MSKTNETMQPEAVETGTLKLDVTVRPIAPKKNTKLPKNGSTVTTHF